MLSCVTGQERGVGSLFSACANSGVEAIKKLHRVIAATDKPEMPREVMFIF